MLSKAHLTSHSTMSGSRSITTSSWLSSTLSPFLYNSTAYSYHFLICSASGKSIPFLYFIVLILAWIVSCICLIFLKRFLVFPILLFFSIYLSCSSRKTLLSSLTILWKFPFSWVYIFLSSLSLVSFFSQLFVKPPQITTLLSWISFSWGWFWSLPLVQCYEPPFIVLKLL